MIIDTHAHYDDEAFDGDREELLSSLVSAGVGRVIDVGSTKASLAKILQLARECPFVYGALGLHPDEVGDLTEETFAMIEEGLSEPKILAVGEIGLDYYWNKEAREVQMEAFRRQALLAIRKELPIIIHSREAAADTLDVVRELYGPGGPGEKLSRKGVMHCYSYSAEMARIYTREIGFFLGIGGVVTYKNGRKLKEVVADTPLEYLLLETDCPYLSPVPLRGKRNSSLNLPYIIEEIAAIKGCS
ncbi:MAG: TatD family hydrolase, partial [Lachnospiraceae bacterium]